MARKTRRRRIRDRQRKRRLRNYLIWGGVAVVVVGIIGYFVWANVRPQSGEAVPIMASTSHVPEGTDPGPYNTDPPTSGQHYPRNLPAGFYTVANAEELGEYPEGFLVHSLEHGYVIFWYNCEAPGVSDCDRLTDQIREVMSDYDDFKVIGFPRSSIDVPVAMTSWGRILKMEEFDPASAARFVERNRFRAPEPNAP